MSSLSVSSRTAGSSLHRRGIAIRRCIVAAAALALVPFAAAQAPENLSGIRTIQVESMGEGANALAMQQRIAERLSRSGNLKAVTNASAADAVLRGSSGIWAVGAISLNPRSKSVSQINYKGYLSVELVNRSNQTLWSYLVTPSRFHSASITHDLADQVVTRLLDAIRSGTANAASSASAAPGTHVALHAAGATLPAPLYRMWFQSSGMNVTYDAVGSEAGIEQLAAGSVDFAASDIPLTGENFSVKIDAAHFPTVLGGVVPIYNLPGLDRDLRLTPQVLAGIYSGNIRKWNDPRILEINHGAHLPDAEIAVVHRSDGSGTTYVWTSYLALLNPEWKVSAGSGARVVWPIGIGATGNDGVADLVQKTPNAIGYVELIYAIQHELNYAAVRNAAGQFIKADLASITAAAEAAASDPDLRSSILNSPGKNAYPISTFTWLLVPKTGLSPEKKAAISDFLNWALTSGQKDCASLGYAPLPHEIVSRELQAVSALK